MHMHKRPTCRGLSLVRYQPIRGGGVSSSELIDERNVIGVKYEVEVMPLATSEGASLVNSQREYAGTTASSDSFAQA
ncbi:hypothetical protein Turpa_0598 [Turneriella parva DSM 21527]|uniref:Uncharacterized protein n=1 Tax=Turneriella parva (strain ATCC BAA-1111 / DSM 21527 / NCTC 11395 / H) TaxID=869212 RepID=I4B1U3_TURPD|nr:hypothetical protein Turpa_0598 [Turneriella parva DSM 21527]